MYSPSDSGVIINSGIVPSLENADKDSNQLRMASSAVDPASAAFGVGSSSISLAP